MLGRKKPDPFEAGRSALERFWGRSNGGGEAYEDLERELVALKLKPEQLRRLKLNLPVPEMSGGTTAAKIRRAAQCLDLLGAA